MAKTTRRLRRTVHVTDPKTLKVTTVRAGTEWTEELGAVIKNRSAWTTDDPAPAPSTPEPPPDGTAGDEPPEAPPRSGRGSGEDAWRAFAQKLEVVVPDGTSRDDIIGYLEERGLIPSDES